MDPATPAREIAPAQLDIQGNAIQLLAFSNPDLFPHGLEVIIMQAGKLTPIGRAHVEKGLIIALLPREMSAQIVGAMQAAAAQAAAAQNGKEKPPGV
jgi:hypothetical protein